MTRSNGHELSNKVALVTGGTRGVGKGVALELARAGATVYVTGRTSRPGGVWPGSLDETVAQIIDEGGRAVGVSCDHTNDEQVRAVFERIEREAGALHVLVNNAYAAAIASGRSQDAATMRFWELPIDAWDRPIDVGLRSHYVSTVYAMPLLLRSKGLVINISSPGAYAYFNSVPYGVGKAGVDRMTRDMALDIGDAGVSIVSLWPGLVGTERVASNYSPSFATKIIRDTRYVASARAGVEPPPSFDTESATEADLHAITETAGFAGRAAVALAADTGVDAKSGRVFSVARLAREYGFTDVDGRIPDAFGYLDSDSWPPLDEQ